MINEFTEYAEDARTSTRLQYGVRLIYRDGRVGIHIRENKLSAQNMVKIHNENAWLNEDWLVERAELIIRPVTVTLGEWDTPGEEQA